MTNPDAKFWTPRIPLQSVLPYPFALIALHRIPPADKDVRQAFLADLRHDKSALLLALEQMFGAEGFPVESGRKEVHWRRDAMGKPFVVWEGAAAEWARNAGRKDAHLHVSNSHDGAAHLALVAYGEEIAGLGIDVVSLPRLRRPEKGRDFLRRFARKIMSNREHEGVLPYLEAEPEEALRVRLAAHFSLMEAASKACGTGLKIGIGLGKPTSLPMHALGAERVEPDTKLLFEGAALARLEALGAQRAEGIWAVDGEFLIAVVILLRGDS